MKLADVKFKDGKNPTQLEMTDGTEFVKERNKRFGVCQDNAKKTHSLTHGCCNKAMQTHLKNESNFENKVKRDPFKTLEMIKLKMHDPSKVKCPCATPFEQLDGLINTKQEEDEAPIKHMKRF